MNVNLPAQNFEDDPVGLEVHFLEVQNTNALQLLGSVASKREPRELDADSFELVEELVSPSD